MQKVFVLGGICLFAIAVQAQTASKNDDRLAFDPETESEIFSVLDMKMFHDREIVQGMLFSLYQQGNAADRDAITQSVFSEEDSALLEKTMDEKQMRYEITPELLKKSEENPFEAFKDMIKSVRIPQMTKEEMSELGKVDDKAIPNMLQMVTESGPNIGAKRVSVIYDNETQE